MKVLGIIPARGGSKGVPRKNKLMVAGKPLIAYTIEAALESERLDTFVVSSDDDEILEIARVLGTKIHERSTEDAEDNSPVTDTVEKVLVEIEGNHGQPGYFDAIMLLQPTSPIRSGQDIDNAINILSKNEGCQTVISVCEMDDVHPARMYKKENNDLIPFIPEWEQLRRQDIPKAYYRNGSIYLTRRKAFEQLHSLMSKPVYSYIMPTSQLLNIDEPRDLIIAESLLKAWKKKEL